VSEAGSVSSLAHYDPYGAARPGSSLPAGIGWTGEWTDPAGLVNLRFRAYDPTLGRFVSRDSVAGELADPRTEGIDVSWSCPWNGIDRGAINVQIRTAVERLVRARE
jgi:RHS repeat-associated protein